MTPLEVFVAFAVAVLIVLAVMWWRGCSVHCTKPLWPGWAASSGPQKSGGGSGGGPSSDAFSGLSHHHHHKMCDRLPEANRSACIKVVKDAKMATEMASQGDLPGAINKMQSSVNTLVGIPPEAVGQAVPCMPANAKAGIKSAISDYQTQALQMSSTVSDLAPKVANWSEEVVSHVKSCGAPSKEGLHIGGRSSSQLYAN